MTLVQLLICASNWSSAEFPHSRMTRVSARASSGSIVDNCGAFIVLIGRDGVGRWIGAETQVALIRYFSCRDDATRLPIFPILLRPTTPESLPAFLRLFQATQWDGI